MVVIIAPGSHPPDTITLLPRQIARLKPMLEEVAVWHTDLVSVLPILAWAYLESGGLARGEQIAEEAVNRATAQSNALALVDALRVQGMVLTREQRCEAAEVAFDASLSLSRRMPYPCAEARALYESGILIGGQNEPVCTRDRLEQALVIFERLGAQKDSEKTRRALQGRREPRLGLTLVVP